MPLPRSVVDCCTNEWLGYAFSKRCGATEAIACLDDVVQDRFPETYLVPGTRIRVDNGPAYRSDRFTDHARDLGFKVEHIQVKPQQRLDWKTPSEYRSEVTVSANQN